MNCFLQMLENCASNSKPVTLVIAGGEIENLVIFNVEDDLLQAFQNGLEIALDVNQVEAILGEQSLFDVLPDMSEDADASEEEKPEEIQVNPLENDMDFIYNAAIQNPLQSDDFRSALEDSFKGFPAVKNEASKLLDEIFSSSKLVNTTPFFQRLVALSSIQAGCETPFSHIKAIIWYKNGRKKQAFQMLKGNSLDYMNLYVAEQMLSEQLFFDYLGSVMITYELPLSQTYRKIVEYYVKKCAVYQDISLLSLWLTEQIEQDVNAQYHSFFAAIILYLYRQFKGDDDISLPQNEQELPISLLEEIYEAWASGNTLERQNDLEVELSDFLQEYEESPFVDEHNESFYKGWIHESQIKPDNDTAQNYCMIKIIGSEKKSPLHISRVADPLLAQLLLNRGPVYRIPVIFRFQRAKNGKCRCSDAFIPLDKRAEYLKKHVNMRTENLDNFKLAASNLYYNWEGLIKIYGEKNLKNAILLDDPKLKSWFEQTVFFRRLLDRTITAEMELPDELKQIPEVEGVLNRYISAVNEGEPKEQEYLLDLIKALMRRNGDEKTADYLEELQRLMGNGHPLYSNDEKISKEVLWKSRILPAVSDGEYSAALYFVERWKELYRGNGGKLREKGPLWEKVLCLQSFCEAMREGREIEEIASDLRDRLTQSELNIIQRKASSSMETQEEGNLNEI